MCGVSCVEFAECAKYAELDFDKSRKNTAFYNWHTNCSLMDMPILHAFACSDKPISPEGM